jgi:NADH:ubiquinone oxidoreductase subunit F (NADH-binding)
MPEKKILLEGCIGGESSDISEYIAKGGFRAWEKVRREMTPFEVIEEVRISRLRGRGGAGFPCGSKWKMVSETASDEKYFICNADEGEVGTFKDRYLIENAPFSLIEGILIGSYAIGATRAYLYLREEYSFMGGKLRSAIAPVRLKGLSDGLEIRLVHGAGAYVCGEESALLESIEGKRGEPRFKPPFPAEVGLFGKPTVINNVETLMNIPLILLNGGIWFASIGTEESSGTKIFCVSGDVKRPGVYELVMGSRLSEILELAGAEEVGLVQVGGAAGHLVPENGLDLALGYETKLGSGAVIIMNKSRDVIEVIYNIMEFFQDESCGKCTPCREGTAALMEILRRFIEGDAVTEDMDALMEISEAMRLSSLCGLGQSAPTALLDGLTFYREDFEKRLEQSVFLRGMRGVSRGTENRR